MREQAWAIQAVPENYMAIISEAPKTVDRSFLKQWFSETTDGYFVRDLLTPSLDCTLQSPENFFVLYKFGSVPPNCEKGCNGAHYRPIDKL